MIFGSIHSMSTWYHVKKLELYQGKSITLCLRPIESLEPILRFLLESFLTSGTSSSYLTSDSSLRETEGLSCDCYKTLVLPLGLIAEGENFMIPFDFIDDPWSGKFDFLMESGWAAPMSWIHGHLIIML